MHHKTKRKLEAAKRVYLGIDGFVYCAIIQLQTQYVEQSLEQEFPSKVDYVKLSKRGFIHREDVYSFTKSETLNLLEESKKNNRINSTTVDVLIERINKMDDF